MGSGKVIEMVPHSNNRRKIAYIQRFIYPDSSASALQSIRMAAALADITGDTSYFIHDLTIPEQELKQEFAITESPLKIIPLSARAWPSWFYANAYTRFGLFNLLIALKLLTSRSWHVPDKKKILVVRSRLERLFWGLMRPYLRMSENWIFITELHDNLSILFGFDPQEINPELPLPTDLQHTTNHRRVQRSLKNFDLVFCPTKAAADDISLLTQGRVQPHVLRHASGLLRAESPIETWPQKTISIKLGYTGAIDKLRGIDQLIQSLHYLPENVTLTLVGAIKGQSPDGRNPSWLSHLLRDTNITERVSILLKTPYNKIAEHISQCDILLLPAGKGLHVQRYASPLKLFDYMVRGKPIVAVDVPCHREILQDRHNALLYKHGDPQNLAVCIQTLADQPRLALKIARNAWEQSADFTYAARARRVLDIVDGILEQQPS